LEKGSKTGVTGVVTPKRHKNPGVRTAVETKKKGGGEQGVLRNCGENTPGQGWYVYGENGGWKKHEGQSQMGATKMSGKGAPNKNTFQTGEADHPHTVTEGPKRSTGGFWRLGEPTKAGTWHPLQPDQITGVVETRFRKKGEREAQKPNGKTEKIKKRPQLNRPPNTRRWERHKKVLFGGGGWW